jgi:hypothetical protein
MSDYRGSCQKIARFLTGPTRRHAQVFVIAEEGDMEDATANSKFDKEVLNVPSGVEKLKAIAEIQKRVRESVQQQRVSFNEETLGAGKVSDKVDSSESNIAIPLVEFGLRSHICKARLLQVPRE